MHTYGHPSKIDQILEISKEYNLKLVEDAAESLGSFYNKKHTGTFGDIGILSFNGNKIITTGGGGALLTEDETLAKSANIFLALLKSLINGDIFIMISDIITDYLI